MTKALERAAEAVEDIWDFDVSPEKCAKAALLAALDPEDEELVSMAMNAITDHARTLPVGSSGHGLLFSQRRDFARVAISALRNHICGESSDGG